MAMRLIYKKDNDNGKLAENLAVGFESSGKILLWVVEPKSFEFLWCVMDEFQNNRNVFGKDKRCLFEDDINSILFYRIELIKTQYFTIQMSLECTIALSLIVKRL